MEFEQIEIITTIISIVVGGLMFHLNYRLASKGKQIDLLRSELAEKYLANQKEIEKNEQAIQDLKTNVINSKFDKVFQMLQMFWRGWQY